MVQVSIALKMREGQMFRCFTSQAPIHPLGARRANTQVASTAVAAVVDAICSRHLGSTLTALNVVVEVTL